MKFIRDIHEQCRAAGRPAISFEFFPPKTDEGDRSLLEKTLPALLAFTRITAPSRMARAVRRATRLSGSSKSIQREHGLTAMMHLTCVNSTREQLQAVIEDARSRGIRNILALRGDPPGGTGPWVPVDGGFCYSSELVAFIRGLDGFCIGTAGFPEGHMAQKLGKQADWQFLAEKVTAGADFVITQIFFRQRRLLPLSRAHDGEAWGQGADHSRHSPSPFAGSDEEVH
jgi:methylenetetrahydrofolate reductase (NADPH)